MTKTTKALAFWFCPILLSGCNVPPMISEEESSRIICDNFLVAWFSWFLTFPQFLHKRKFFSPSFTNSPWNAIHLPKVHVSLINSRIIISYSILNFERYLYSLQTDAKNLHLRAWANILQMLGWITFSAKYIHIQNWPCIKWLHRRCIKPS